MEASQKSTQEIPRSVSFICDVVYFFFCSAIFVSFFRFLLLVFCLGFGKGKMKRGIFKRKKLSTILYVLFVRFLTKLSFSQSLLYPKNTSSTLFQFNFYFKNVR